MRSVMMDRWGIDSAFQYLSGGLQGAGSYPLVYNHFGYDLLAYQEAYFKKCTDQCWENLLMAVILWDEIWSFNQEPYDWESIFRGRTSIAPQYLNKIIRSVNPPMIDRKVSAEYYLLTDQHSISRHLQLKHNMMHNLCVTPSLRARTFSYQAISQCLGIPYLAHPFRVDSVINNNSQNSFSRKDVIKRVDEELNAYYSYINAELGRDLYRFHYPVLIDMIKQNASAPEDELLFAMELREESDVSDFRKAINTIEQAVQDGKSQELLGELEFVSDLAKKITTKYKGKGVTQGEFSISIPFSVSTSIPWPQIMLRDLKNKYKPQATFIRRLIDYGVNKRPLGK